jgi:hypothetical protein
MAFVLSDYDAALARSSALDNRLLSSATSVAAGAAYADLICLTARQVFGSMELTIGMGTDGKPNRTDAEFYMRNTNGAAPGCVLLFS